MGWFILKQIIALLLEWRSLRRYSEHEKNLEILLLRKQLAILQRQHTEPLRNLSRIDKLMLVVLSARLRTVTGRTIQQLRAVVRIVQPETVFRWHRELVGRKWNHHTRRRGRPRTPTELEQLVVRLACEHPDWGYSRLHDEMVKLGSKVSRSTIANRLRRHDIRPGPDRGSVNWQHLMQHYKHQLLACDFFTVETHFLQTIYVLFFIEVGSRHVHVAGCTTNPHYPWVTQQARHMVWRLREKTVPIRFLIHDRDSSFSKHFDDVFASENIHVIKTPPRAPKANAYAERWIRSIRSECLDKLLIINEAHLRRVMTMYVDYYNNARPHQGIHQQTPNPQLTESTTGQVCCRNVLGGIIHDYYRAA